MKIGGKLRELRIQLNLTQEELANRCELSKGFISQVERDLASPSISTLTDMLECLGSSLQAFFAEERKEKVVFAPQDMFRRADDGAEAADRLAGAGRKERHGPFCWSFSPAAPPELPPQRTARPGLFAAGRKKQFTIKRGYSFLHPPPHCLKNTGHKAGCRTDLHAQLLMHHKDAPMVVCTSSERHLQVRRHPSSRHRPWPQSQEGFSGPSGCGSPPRASCRV